ncbi:response regulator [Echinicola pacifica]|uniref:Response regulator n=1 Tax=Echinicola pacifica TaxID=346377 RepID=A0A918QE42_9BACT|nr:response regulator [Echinicola pacifica]GGZ41990.1 response regulator [Echinicola pacifica]
MGTPMVLLIDDDEINNYVNSSILHKEFPHLEIKQFTSAEEALAHILSNADIPYYIFLDINMPLMNGWEFLDELDKLDIILNLTIFMLTSSIDQADRDRVKTYSRVNQFLVKPLQRTFVQSLFNK